MLSSPASLAPSKLPCRKSGVMVSPMMRFDIASVSTPSSPYPTSMRTRWSFLATMSSAPSSTFLRPSFHCSTTRIEYCSISSGCVVGTTSTASCAPLAASKAASFCSSAFCCSAVRVPVRSVTREVSFGIGSRPSAPLVCAVATPSHSSSSGSARAARRAARRAAALIGLLGSGLVRGRCGRLGRRRGSGGRGIEGHRGRGSDLLLVLDREVRLHLEAENLRGDVRGEGAHGHVVVLHGPDVAVAGHSDAVLGALELRLQIAEVLIRLQLRIVLGDGEQTLQRLRQLALRGLELLEQLGVVE